MTATPTNNRTPREVVDFPLNAPVTVALKYNQGRTISGQNGERMMFSLVDGRVMFLDPETAGKIVTLGVNVRESFTITRKWDGTKGLPTTWEVARVAGEQPNGTFAVPALSTTSTDAQSNHSGVSPKPPALATSATNNGGRRQPGQALIDEANALVDAYALVLDRALTTYQGRIKPEEARSLLVTAYIQRAKLSSVA
jgi:hypothetical protein